MYDFQLVIVTIIFFNYSYVIEYNFALQKEYIAFTIFPLLLSKKKTVLKTVLKLYILMYDI